MNDRNNETKTVYAVTERNGKSFWTKVGVAFVNSDGSLNVNLDALPISGKLQIRDGEERREPPVDGRSKLA
jgi:hypothetical protein